MKRVFFKAIKDKKFRKIKKERPGCWIHYDNATKESLEEATALSQIDFADIADSLDSYELPRIERENGAVIIYLRIPFERKKELLKHTELLTVIITKNYFITISKERSGFIEKFLEKVDPQSITTTQTTKLLLQMLWFISADYTKKVRSIRDNIVKKTSRISKITNEIIVDLLKYEEILEEYLLSLTPTKNIINAILSGNYLSVFEEDKELLEDLKISIQQSVDICDITSRNLKAMRDSYQIIFTNDLNRIMKFLAGFTIILTIPNIISGIYGMNVALPFQNNPSAFIFILLLVSVLTLVSLYIFKRKNWL